MIRAIEQFRRNIEEARNLGQLYTVLSRKTTSALNVTDLLRAELVFAVSAIDQYVHELVRIGMLECCAGGRAQAQAFGRFQVTLQGVMGAINPPSPVAWLDDEIRTRHSFQSFQHPDKIADAIRLISDVPLWDEVAKGMGMKPKEVKQRLVLIIERRNKIAHEADVDPSFPGKRWPIDAPMVDDAVRFLSEIAESIFALVK